MLLGRLGIYLRSWLKFLKLRLDARPSSARLSSTRSSLETTSEIYDGFNSSSPCK